MAHSNLINFINEEIFFSNYITYKKKYISTVVWVLVSICDNLPRCQLFISFCFLSPEMWFLNVLQAFSIFQTLNLPQEPKDSRSSSDSSTKGTDHLHRIHYISKDRQIEPRQPTFDTLKGEKGKNNYIFWNYKGNSNINFLPN